MELRFVPQQENALEKNNATHDQRQRSLGGKQPPASAATGWVDWGHQVGVDVDEAVEEVDEGCEDEASVLRVPDAV